MANIETLKIDHKRMPEIEMRKVGYRSIYANDGELYQIALSAHGVDVTRTLTMEDLISIRDWCNEVIAVDGEVMVAAE